MRGPKSLVIDTEERVAGQADSILTDDVAGEPPADVSAVMVGYLTGTVVCVSGLSSEERKQVKEQVEAEGGSYTPELSRACTHLVVPKRLPPGLSSKVDLAARNVSNKRWQTHIVDLEWLAQCCSESIRVSEQPYIHVLEVREASRPYGALPRVPAGSGRPQSPLKSQFAAGLVRHPGGGRMMASPPIIKRKSPGPLGNVTMRPRPHQPREKRPRTLSRFAPQPGQSAAACGPRTSPEGPALPAYEQENQRSIGNGQQQQQQQPSPKVLHTYAGRPLHGGNYIKTFHRPGQRSSTSPLARLAAAQQRWVVQSQQRSLPHDDPQEGHASSPAGVSARRIEVVRSEPDITSRWRDQPYNAPVAAWPFDLAASHRSMQPAGEGSTEADADLLQQRAALPARAFHANAADAAAGAGTADVQRSGLHRGTWAGGALAQTSHSSSTMSSRSKGQEQSTLELAARLTAIRAATQEAQHAQRKPQHAPAREAEAPTPQLAAENHRIMPRPYVHCLETPQMLLGAPHTASKATNGAGGSAPSSVAAATLSGTAPLASGATPAPAQHMTDAMATLGAEMRVSTSALASLLAAGHRQPAATPSLSRDVQVAAHGPCTSTSDLAAQLLRHQASGCKPPEGRVEAEIAKQHPALVAGSTQRYNTAAQPGRQQLLSGSNMSSASQWQLAEMAGRSGRVNCRRGSSMVATKETPSHAAVGHPNRDSVPEKRCQAAADIPAQPLGRDLASLVSALRAQQARSQVDQDDLPPSGCRLSHQRSCGENMPCALQCSSAAGQPERILPDPEELKTRPAAQLSDQQPGTSAGTEPAQSSGEADQRTASQQMAELLTQLRAQQEENAGSAPSISPPAGNLEPQELQPCSTSGSAGASAASSADPHQSSVARLAASLSAIRSRETATVHTEPGREVDKPPMGRQHTACHREMDSVSREVQAATRDSSGEVSKGVPVDELGAMLAAVRAQQQQRQLQAAHADTLQATACSSSRNKPSSTPQAECATVQAAACAAAATSHRHDHAAEARQPAGSVATDDSTTQAGGHAGSSAQAGGTATHDLAALLLRIRNQPPLHDHHCMHIAHGQHSSGTRPGCLQTDAESTPGTHQPVAGSSDDNAAGATGVCQPALDARGLTESREPAHGLEAEASSCSAAAGSKASRTAAEAAGPAQPEGAAVFAAMRAILDPDLSAGDADRVHEALQAGGGCLAKGAYLGTKATHVICHPEAAPRWMAMGISIVSPQWILRSLEQGSQQRCFQMSLDALRRLPGSSTAPSAHPAGISIGGSQTPGEAGGASNGGQNRDGGVGDPADSRSEPELAARLDSREARAALLASMHAAASDQQTGCAPVHNPVTLLDGICWAVTALPSHARRDALHSPGLAASGLLPAAQEDLILDTPEAKDDQADELMSATQQTVDAICDAAGGQPGSGERTPCGSGARKLSEEAWEEPIYKAPSLTLLLPLDRKGECGHETRTLAVASKGLTRRALLHHIFQFYQEPMSIQEQMRVMQRGGHAGKLVQAAFVDMKPLRRGALLESRCHLEGLTRVSRERTATIYELSLGS